MHVLYFFIISQNLIDVLINTCIKFRIFFAELFAEKKFFF